jgi:hypothetical protein
MRSREEIPRLREFPRVLASEAALPVGDCTAKFQRLAAVTRMRVIINREECVRVIS